ncbi:MAG: hypothetical protein ACPG6V_08730 [Flavobacteriales bacterium]
MNNIDFKTFVKTGKLLGLDFGKSTVQELFAVMGSTDDKTDFQDTVIYYYGWYEFYVWKSSGILYAFQNDHLISDCRNHNELIAFKNHKVHIEPWFVQKNQNVSYHQLKQFLQEQEIEYKAYQNKYQNQIIELNTNITFDFDTYQGQLVVNAIRLFTYE